MTLAQLPSTFPSYSWESLYYFCNSGRLFFFFNHAWKNMNYHILGRKKFYELSEERKGYKIQGYQPPCSE